MVDERWYAAMGKTTAEAKANAAARLRGLVVRKLADNGIAIPDDFTFSSRVSDVRAASRLATGDGKFLFDILTKPAMTPGPYKLGRLLAEWNLDQADIKKFPPREAFSYFPGLNPNSPQSESSAVSDTHDEVAEIPAPRSTNESKPATAKRGGKIGATVLESSRVREYDVRATDKSGGSSAVILIQDREVIADRAVPAALVRRMHPRAEPAIIRITGDSMSPTYRDGACLLVDAAVRHPSPPGAYVLWDGSSHIVQRCQVVLSSNPPLVRVISDNEAYETQIVPASELHICGSVFCELDPETWEQKSA